MARKGSAATGPAAPLPGPWSTPSGSTRHRYFDNLKVLLIAGIIAGHAVASYSDLDFWSYSEMREVTLSTVTEIVLLAVAAPFTLVLIPLLFLVAGLLTKPSLDRKGPGAYARDRLLRLGVPFALYVVLLQPLLMYPVHPPGETPQSYWAEFIGGGEQTLDTGPLWFVGVLLIFSLSYAGWMRLHRGSAPGPAPADVSAGALWALAAAVAIATFLVRLQIPLAGSNRYVSLNLWEWPACLALFALGIRASEHRWAVAVPVRIHRHARAATLAALGAFALFAVLIAVLDRPADELWGGWRWPALVFVLLESQLVVFGPLWLLAVAQRGLDRPLRWIGPAVCRSAYGAFVLQGIPLIGLAFALRPLPAPAEVKAVLVAGGSVLASFALAWLLVTRVPGVRRLL
jgi:hypothetical protein